MSRPTRHDSPPYCSPRESSPGGFLHLPWRSSALLLSLVLLLASCGTPPSYRVRVLDSPDGRRVPATQRPYEVNGERFEPLANAEGFVEEGVASWYGPDFHGKKTSNGEVYDMHGLTAAHKTLPMNVYVRVTNRSSGRQLDLRINDRGPFVSGRIIDLSYAAARELGVVGPGTAPVRVETLGYLQSSPAGAPRVYRQPPSYVAGPFTLQVGAFSQRDNAMRLAEQLRSRYGEASVVEGWVSGTLYHRVRVGLYNSIAHAERARTDFAALGYRSSFVVARD